MNFHVAADNRSVVTRTGPFRWRVELPRLPDGTNGDYNVECKYFQIENYFPVVVAGISDTILYTYNGVDNFLVIAEGNYDIYDLVESVQTGLQAVDAGFALDFDNQQMTVSLYIPPGVRFQLRRNSLDNDYDYGSDPVDRCLELLGWNFTGGELTLDGGATGYTWIPNNKVRCAGPKWVDLCTSLPIRGSYTYNKGHFNFLSRCSFAGTRFGDDVLHMPPQPEIFPVNLLGFSNFELFIVDDHGVPLSRGFSTVENIIIGYRLSFTPIQPN